MKLRHLFLLLTLGPLAGCAQAEAPTTEEPAAEEEAAAPAEPGRGQVEAEIGDATITVDYGRPALEGRDMLARLPDGEVWRLGKDAATGFTTSTDLSFGDTQVAAGSYTLFVRKVSADEWVLLVNSETGQWGTNYNSEYDVAEIPLEKSETEENVETFTIQVNPTGEGGGELVFEWGTLRLRAAFQVG